MMPRYALAFLLIAGMLCYQPASAEVVFSGPYTHTGMCEASGASFLPRSGAPPAFLIFNDEDNLARIYEVGKDGGPLQLRGGNLQRFLSRPKEDDEKADLEGATRIGDLIYVIGSHSRSGNKGKVRPLRQVFFSVRVADGVDGFTLSPTNGKPATSLLPAIAAAHPELAKAIRLDLDESPALTPETGGLNIEGLATHPNGGSVLIGLRNPLGPDRRAWLLVLENPKNVVEHSAEPKFGSPIPVDLGGNGMRSAEYSPDDAAVFLVAGPTGNEGAFELYRWSGKPADKPVSVEGSRELFAAHLDFQPEAMLVLSKGKLLLLSDDGDRVLTDGKACKKHLPDEQTFRSFIVDIR